MQDSFINSSSEPLDIKAALSTSLDEAISSEFDEMLTEMSNLLT